MRHRAGGTRGPLTRFTSYAGVSSELEPLSTAEGDEVPS